MRVCLDVKKNNSQKVGLFNKFTRIDNHNSPTNNINMIIKILRRSATVGADSFDSLDNVHTLDNLAEDNVTTIQPLSLHLQMKIP